MNNIASRTQVSRRSATVEPLVLDREMIQMFCVDGCDGDVDLVTELVEMYLNSVQSLLGRMEQASTEGDATLLYRTAHTLKSNSRIFGAESLALLCEQIEKRAKQNRLSETPQMVRSVLAQGEQLPVRILAELQALGVAVDL